MAVGQGSQQGGKAYLHVFSFFSIPFLWRGCHFRPERVHALKVRGVIPFVSAFHQYPVCIQQRIIMAATGACFYPDARHRWVDGVLCGTRG